MAEKKYKLPPVPQSPKAKSKFATVMREHKAGTLHHGTSGKTVPKNRPDIARAIAASEARKATKRKSA